MNLDELSASLSVLKNKRGALLGNHVRDLERNPENPDVPSQAAIFLVKLEALNKQYVDIFYEILALINDEDDMWTESGHKCDYIPGVDIRLHRLIEGVCSLETTDNGNKALMRRSM